MIGRIYGIIISKQPPEVLIDVNGIGYEVQAPMSAFYQMPDEGQAVCLHTHFVVREDAQILFGFAELADRKLFRTLIKVNGVGPKLALTIMSGIETDHFVSCVKNDDTAALVKLPGVGKKTAERLLIEMRDKLNDWADIEVAGAGASLASNGYEDEAVEALIALGYKQSEAVKYVASYSEETFTSSQALIRKVLRSMVRG